MSTTTIITNRHHEEKEVTLHAGQMYVIYFKVALHVERAVAKFLEENFSDLLFSLRPHAGTQHLNAGSIVAIEPALKGSMAELPRRVKWEEVPA